MYVCTYACMFVFVQFQLSEENHRVAMAERQGQVIPGIHLFLACELHCWKGCEGCNFGVYVVSVCVCVCK